YSRELVAHVPFIYELIPQVQAQLHGRLARADAQQIYTVEYEWINRRREVCRGKQSGSHYVAIPAAPLQQRGQHSSTNRVNCSCPHGTAQRFANRVVKE